MSPSKTPIVPINREFMPRDEKELERCERTVYVNQIDRAVPGSAVEAMFENFCGSSPRGLYAVCVFCVILLFLESRLADFCFVPLLGLPCLVAACCIRQALGAVMLQFL